MYTRSIVRSTIALAVLACLSAHSAHAQLVADLAADWSDTNNSNTATFGTWSYRQGTSLLPHVANWTQTTPAQPAWAPGTVAGGFLPAEFKAINNNFGWLTGDVIIHTTDPFNGIGFGVGNFLWTSPIDGTITISGDAFEARGLPGRNNAWSLLVNGVTVSAGNLIPGDGYDRTNPFLFSTGSGGVAVLTQNVTVGSTIDLVLTDIGGTSGGGGDFVGVNLHLVSASAVPEPGSVALLIGLCVAGAGFVRKCCCRS